MKIGIVCFPTYGGSGVVATELGKSLAWDLQLQVKGSRFRSCAGFELVLKNEHGEYD